MANIGLNSTQLKEHYALCIQLCSTNKINTKNAFGLHIIDYMNQLTKNQKDGNLNFKLVSSTLDVGTKIYSNRVDSVNTQAQKVASNLHHALDDKKENRNENDEDDDEENGEDQQTKKRLKQRQHKKNKTIGTKESVTLTQLEFTGEQDQLFLKLSSTVDVGAANSFLIETLDIDSTYTYRIDSNEPYYRRQKIDKQVEQENAENAEEDNNEQNVIDDEQKIDNNEQEATMTTNVEFNEFHDKFNDLIKIEHLKICPRLDSFNFNNLNDEFDYGQNSAYAFRNLSTQDDNLLFNDDLDINDNLDDCYDENQMPAALDGSGGNEFGNMQNEYSLAHKSIINSDNAQFILGIIDALSDNPTDYCLFDKKITLAWAGHDYWKPNPVYRMKMNQLAQNKENVEKVKRARKVFAEINFDNYQDEQIAAKQEIKLKSNTLTNWMENKTLLLPEDFKREPIDFVTRFSRDPFNLLLRNRKGNLDNSNNNIFDDDYNDLNNNEDDNGENKNNDDDENSDAAGTEFNFQDDFDYGTQETEQQQQYGGPMPFIGDNLVDQPQIIPTINLPYTKFAKKIDVKRLKSAIWDLIQTNDDEFNETRKTNLIQNDSMEVDVSKIHFVTYMISY